MRGKKKNENWVFYWSLKKKPEDIMTQFAPSILS